MLAALAAAIPLLIAQAAAAPATAAVAEPFVQAPAGVLTLLLAVAGYVLGTYAGLVCMQMLKVVAQAAGG